MRKVDVYYNEIFAGVLTETDERKYVFAYNDDYADSDNPSVSLTLPKQQRRFESDYLFPFFANMLPEGANKSLVCRYKHIDEADQMGLLIAFCDKDFIGAVSVKKHKSE